MEPYWARVTTDGPYPLRRGAWYPVNELAKDHVLLDVLWAPVNVPRAAVEIAEERPLRWTVVPRPRQAVSLPESWGPVYGVCPNCGHRASLQNAPPILGCQQCEGLFPVAWDEKYLGRK
jgi:hypothetical protein